MNTEKLQDAIGEVRSDFINDADIVIKKKKYLWNKSEKNISEKSNEKKPFKRGKFILIPLIAVILIAITGLGVWKITSTEKNTVTYVNENDETEQILVQENYGGEVETVIVPGNETASEDQQEVEISTSGATPPESNDDRSGGIGIIEQTTDVSASETYNDGTGIIDDGSYIPAPPNDHTIYVEGEEITDSEAQRYFDENYISITSALNASGVPIDNLRFSEKGYCHVLYNGTENSRLEIRQNFRDYLAYSGNRLVAIITLTKENGEIHNSPAFGAYWFDSYNETLQNHKGEKLVFVYVGNSMELFIAPDGHYYNPIGWELGVDFGSDDIYSMFYHEKAVYIP